MLARGGAHVYRLTTSVPATRRRGGTLTVQLMVFV